MLNALLAYNFILQGEMWGGVSANSWSRKHFPQSLPRQGISFWTQRRLQKFRFIHSLIPGAVEAVQESVRIVCILLSSLLLNVQQDWGLTRLPTLKARKV